MQSFYLPVKKKVVTKKNKLNLLFNDSEILNSTR